MVELVRVVLVRELCFAPDECQQTGWCHDCLAVADRQVEALRAAGDNCTYHDWIEDGQLTVMRLLRIADPEVEA